MPSLPMNSRAVGHGSIRFLAGSLTRRVLARRRFPKPTSARSVVGFVGLPALCVAIGLLRKRDGRYRPSYGTGTGVSW